ncbi:MAG TPA: type VI secretion system-associated FHA domain protein [Polyangiaceae bacterium]|nr:type VI secretion system-associated FHA domain protein [Polyangiaceae bacterium]
MTETLKLEVYSDRRGEVTVHSFPRLPISIGRHSGNDLPLRQGFVSNFHARIERVGGRLSVVDLGSTNGIHVTPSARRRKARLRSHARHDLEASDFEFSIGTYKIRVIPSEQRPLASAQLPSLPSLPSLPASPAASDPLSLPSLEACGAAVRAPARARQVATSDLPHTPEAVALAGLQELVSAFAPNQSLETSGDVARLVARLHAAIDVLCRAFVQLRRSQARCASALALPGHDSAPGAKWDEIQDPARLASELLDFRRGSQDVSRALLAGFNEVAIHQVALLDGVLEGVRALLTELAPTSLEAEVDRGPARRSFCLGGRSKARWQIYQRRHRELSQGDAALSLVFGPAFSQAYGGYRQQASQDEPARSARGPRKLC